MIPRDILISVILVSMFVVGAGLFLGDMGSRYAVQYDNNWSNTYNAVNNISSDLNTQRNSLQATGASPVGFLEYISTGAWQALTMLFNSSYLIKAMVEDFGNRLNIPTIFIGGFLAIVTIGIVFALISAIFRRKT